MDAVTGISSQGIDPYAIRPREEQVEKPRERNREVNQGEEGLAIPVDTLQIEESTESNVERTAETRQGEEGQTGTNNRRDTYDVGGIVNFLG